MDVSSLRVTGMSQPKSRFCDWTSCGCPVQDILEDLFLRHEVDMVMTGHVHLYARTCSVKRDRCKKAGRGGITHVTVGAYDRRLLTPSPSSPSSVCCAALLGPCQSQ